MIKPLDAKEWLEQQRLAGCDFADELLILWDSQEEAEENQGMIWDMENQAPPEIRNSSERWRLVEWVIERLGLLDKLKDTLDKKGYEGDEGDVDSMVDAVLYDLDIALENIEELEAEIAELKKPAIIYDL